MTISSLRSPQFRWFTFTVHTDLYAAWGERMASAYVYLKSGMFEVALAEPSQDKNKRSVYYSPSGV